jgi:thiol:disulfide interchange protein DsbD
VLARLVLHPDAGTAAGELRVGVLLEMDPGWHVYGRDPGDVGLATTISWQAEGAAVSNLPWPEAQRFEEMDGELVSWGYEGRVLLPALLHFPPGERPARLRAEVDVLACRVECVPGSFQLERDTRLTAAEIAAKPQLRAAFAQASAHDPVPPGGRADAAAAGPGIWRALGLGLLGGLLLNLMPCVLPVLAIKAMSLAELARRGPRQALPHAAAYAAGVLGSMLALALIVVALRAAGSAVGWGFQFQEPRYVAGVSAVLVLFAANFFGVFEFEAAPGALAGVGNNAVGARRSFFDGLLTVALATPCTAPFLGTAAGFAFASPAPVTFAVFLAIGLGLAAPLAVVALFPGSAKRLPRAGPWMEELRTALGFLLLATVVWLLWVLGRSLDPGAMAGVQLLLLCVAFLAWVQGRLQKRDRAPRPLLAGAAASMVLLLGLTALGSATPAPSSAGSWNRNLVEAELRDGRAAFVVFTADWCLTCKMNERLVIANERVQTELVRLDVAVFEADWTRRDETIRAELARFGRSGVPLYLVFSPNQPDEPVLLPELLSVERVLQALRAAADSDRVTGVTRPGSGVSIQGSV